MTQDDGGYDVKPNEPPATPPPPPSNDPPATPKPGEPGWVPPVPVIEKAEAEAEEPPVDPDVEKNKGMAILAYICFIIPLIAAPSSKFARFHANQGLLVFIFWCVAILANIALYVIHNLMYLHLQDIAVLYGFFTCAIYLAEPAFLVAALALTLYGIIQAANGEKKHLPIVGQLTLIK